jgi:hypothetical protein
MFRLHGTKGNDYLSAYWADEPVELSAGRGNDEATGTRYDDWIYGGLGNDFLSGREGNDVLLGAKGLDEVSDFEGWNELRGGYGNDIVGGVGLLVGGPGSDAIIVQGGTAYGDEGPGGTLPYNGRDNIHTDFAVNPWLSREMYGGANGDMFDIYFAPADGVATRLDIRDWAAAEGDELYVASPDPFLQNAALFDALDTNDDRALDGLDGQSDVGLVWSDPNANATCIQLGDGDMLAVWNTQSLSASDFFGL